MIVNTLDSSSLDKFILPFKNSCNFSRLISAFSSTLLTLKILPNNSFLMVSLLLMFFLQTKKIILVLQNNLYFWENKPMQQKYHHYTKWEDYLNGMWNRVHKEEENEMLHVAIEFTGDHKRYGKAMDRVIKEWPITCEHNLTNESINQKAFIGHCAVCLELGIPEYITRMAWPSLSEQQQILANKEAERAIKLWKQNYKLESTLKCGNKGVTQMEFQMKHQTNLNQTD